MKNILYYLLLMLPIIFSACSHDDADELFRNNSLNGTTWEASGDEGWFKFKKILKFHESTYDLSGYENINGYISEISFTASYRYKHPYVYLYEPNLNEEDVAIISGNKLSFEDDDDIVYIKK